MLLIPRDGEGSGSLVGLPGFEPRTSASRTQRATKLRHSPSVVPPGEITSEHTLPKAAQSSSSTTPPGSRPSGWRTSTSAIRRLSIEWTRRFQDSKSRS